MGGGAGLGMVEKVAWESREKAAEGIKNKKIKNSS